MSRIRVLYYSLILMFLFLAGALFWFQVYRGKEFFKESEQNRIRLVSLASPRGRILDRNGILLAGNKASFELSVIPEEIFGREDVVKVLVGLLNNPSIDEKFVTDKLEEGKNLPFVPVVITRGISFETLAKIEERSLELTGVVVTPFMTREYPKRSFLSHVLGYVGAISPAEYESLKDSGYLKWDVIGKAGIEKQYDKIIKGERGWKHLEMTASGRFIKTLREIPVIPGSDMVLTIDSDIQQVVEEALAGHRGACIVLGSETGEILALASSPEFDPNNFGSEGVHDSVQEYFKNPARPLFNRCVQALYSPGSVFKIVLSLASLSTGVLEENSTLSCDGGVEVGGRRFHCMGHHGQIALLNAIERSCNSYFYRAGLKLGPNRISEYAQKLGLGNLSGIDLPYEKSGLVPSKEWKRKNIKRDPRWYDGETAVFSIGQGYLQVTPLQLLLAANTVVNGGKLFHPKIVKMSRESSGYDLRSVPQDYAQIPINPYHAGLIKEGLFQAVHGASGTGKRARVNNYEIGGKTGTVQIKSSQGPQRDHGWFFGFSPVDKPKFSLIVFIENEGYGGDIPANIAHTVFESLWNKEEFRKIYAQTD